MGPLSPEQQVRFNLAMQMKIDDIDKLEAVYQWVMGPKQSILPVSRIVQGPINQ